MKFATPSSDNPETSRSPFWMVIVEVAALVALFFIYAGDPPPAVNEAHYLVKAKNFWDPTYCSEDLFAASGKAHVTFYWTFGVLTQWMSLTAVAWIGRLVGWTLIAVGLSRCCHAIGLPAFRSLAVAVLWLVGIEYFNLAGEWVVGGIEAKVPAYGLVLIGFSDIVRRKWAPAWVWLGAASAFHVLTGGWAVVAATVAFVVTERWHPAAGESRVKFFTPGLVAGGLLALFGLIPALRLTLGATSEASLIAAKIYSYVRIRHHLLPSDFPWHWFARHAVLVGALILWWRHGPSDGKQRRLIWIGLGALAITIGGLLVGALPALAPDLAARLLRYYWFRLGDAVVPLVLALGVMHLLFISERNALDRKTIFGLRGIALVALGLFVWSSYERLRIGVPPSVSHRLLGWDADASPAQQRQTFADWLAVCDWIRVATPDDEVFLTPRHQQTFKWYADRAEVVNWKDVPQDAASLLRWQERFDDVFPRQLGSVPLSAMRVPINYGKLREYRRRYGVRFMLVDNRIATDQLPLVKLYPAAGQLNETYSVYELPYD